MKTLKSIYQEEYNDETIFITKKSEKIQHIELTMISDCGFVFAVNVSYDREDNFNLQNEKRYFVYGITTSSNYSFTRHDDYVKMIYNALDCYFGLKSKIDSYPTSKEGK